MLDAPLRRILAPSLDAAGTRLARAGVNPTALTAVGWVLGVGACAAAGLRAWPVALALWLANRLLDGVDGPTARRGIPTDRGGFLDVVADFSIYAGFVVGVAVAEPAARLACVALLTAYYCSGTAFLALSSLTERRRQQLGDDRSLRFVGGVAEGTETIVVYILFTLLPGHAAGIAWGFTAAVGVTAIQRIALGLRLLGTPAAPAGPTGLAVDIGPPAERTATVFQVRTHATPEE